MIAEANSAANYSVEAIKSASLSILSIMALISRCSNAAVLLMSVVCFMIPIALARPATYLQDFRTTWGDTHIRQLDGGRAIQLVLDQNSGTVTAFYMNFDTNTIRDELDFEFLGNRTGQPYTVQTNVYAHGKGDREQRVNLWFDPAAAFHTYSILWSNNECNMMREIIGAGQPYTVQTNVYAHGKGDREQKVNLWFDPATAFHTYSILWSNECNMMRDIIGAGEQEEVTESIVFPEASMSK